MRHLLSGHALVLSVSCGGDRLDKAQAERIVREAIADPEVELNIMDISQDASRPTEAIATAFVERSALRLKFRRFDAGWKWEAAELVNRKTVRAEPVAASSAPIFG